MSYLTWTPQTEQNLKDFSDWQRAEAVSKRKAVRGAADDRPAGHSRSAHRVTHEIEIPDIVL